jgi:cobalamin biosynthetic protein CobC
LEGCNLSSSKAVAHAIVHGGNLDEARRRFPEAPEPWIDLSTGINPLPYPVPDLAADDWARLPTQDREGALLDAAARRYRVASGGMIVAAPGTQALIQVLPRLVSPCRVAVVGPTYEEHKASWMRCGHDLAVVGDLREAGSADAVIVVNPNNPTGRLFPPETLRAFAEARGGKLRLLVVDEAFMDVMPATASLIPALPPATVVLRSFGKFYGLAGVRLGFAIAEPAIATPIAAELGPWAVSGPAIEIGTAALSDEAWSSATMARLAHDQQRLDAILCKAGFSIMGGTPLFRLATIRNAAEVAEKLGRHGIHVRVFPAEPCWLRFGLPGPSEDWDRLERALAG